MNVLNDILYVSIIILSKFHSDGYRGRNTGQGGDRVVLGVVQES